MGARQQSSDAVCSPQAMLSSDGPSIRRRRVQFHEESFPNVRDVVVEIEVNGSCRFRDKAKYEEARRIAGNSLHKRVLRRCTPSIMTAMPNRVRAGF